MNDRIDGDIHLPEIPDRYYWEHAGDRVNVRNTADDSLLSTIRRVAAGRHYFAYGPDASRLHPHHFALAPEVVIERVAAELNNPVNSSP